MNDGNQYLAGMQQDMRKLQLLNQQAFKNWNDAQAQRFQNKIMGPLVAGWLLFNKNISPIEKVLALVFMHIKKLGI